MTLNRKESNKSRKKMILERKCKRISKRNIKIYQQINKEKLLHHQPSIELITLQTNSIHFLIKRKIRTKFIRYSLHPNHRSKKKVKVNFRL